MSILCKLFGHRPPCYSRFSGGDYGKVRVGTTDGIGRVHAHVSGECPRCEETYTVVRIHVPEIEK